MQIRDVLREYLQQYCRRDGDALEITDSTPLLTWGILDSIAVMQMLTFIEARFEIEFEPRDLDRRRLDTIQQIEDLVRRKLVERPAGPENPAGTS